MPQAQKDTKEIEVQAETIETHQLGPNQFVLPSGAIATDLSDELTGDDYFLWQQKLLNLTGGDRKNLGKTLEANKWMACKAFLIDGEKLNVMQLNKMPFKDVAMVMGRVSGFLAASQQEET